MKRARTALALGIVCAATWPADPADAQGAEPAPLEIYYGFTLIDGSGGPPIQDAAMAVRGNEIVTVSRRRELLAGPDAPRDAVPVNLGGGWVIPGLVDAHVHLATSPNRERAEQELARLLYGGVTAVRDMAGDGRTLAALARDTRLGQIPGPDVFYSALVAGPSFFEDPRPRASAQGERPGDVPWLQAVTPETDLPLAIARARGTSATGLKVYANLDVGSVARLTEEAHRQGMEVWAHSMVFPARPLEVVRAGVDVVSHVCRLAWEAMEDAPDEYHHDRTAAFGAFTATSPVFTELFGEMLARGTILDATLALYARTDSVRAESPDRTGGEACDTGFARALVARAYELGVPIAAGTDFVAAPEDPFPALLTELDELVRHGGLSPMAAIEAGTRIAAEAAGVEDTHGSLRHGRAVNFVLLDRDPLADIANLRSVRAVWKNAQRYDRSAYRSSVVRAEDAGTGATEGLASPREAFEAWLAMWRRYDLERLAGVFVEGEALTYSAPDTQGVLEGYEAVEAYHRSIGFARGGAQPQQELWVEDVLVAEYTDAAVVTGEWRFGNRVSDDVAGRGPLTLVVVRISGGWKLAHVHLGGAPAVPR